MSRSDNDRRLEMPNLKGRGVAIIGYGSQGRAQALNLRDSGIEALVGLYAGSRSWDRAESDGLRVFTVERAVELADVVMILTDDISQKDIYENQIRPAMSPGDSLGFAHGFNISFGQIRPAADINVFMVAPKGPGHMVRSQFVTGGGVPCLIAVHQDPSGGTRGLALDYAAAIGGAKAGVLETTFREETETDLFGEQAILCGGVSELIKAGFETLVDAGYQPQVAYFECLHEMKLIVDLIYQGGLTHMRRMVSDTAEFGDYVSGSRVIGKESRKEMRRILSEIRDGSFARRWIGENASGRPFFNTRRDVEKAHSLETVGRELRKMMSWIQADAGSEGERQKES